MTFTLKWTQYADGKWAVAIRRIENQELIAVHSGARTYLWDLIVRRGYNR